MFEQISLSAAAEILASDSNSLLQELLLSARNLTRRYFGRTISLYAPLYISNFCENYCLYCGFNHGQKIKRIKLNPAEIEAECRILAGRGIQSILLLTGESREQSPVNYIREAVIIAAGYFASVALEIYPLQTKAYQKLYTAGADGVTLYQETYDKKTYLRLHPRGPKSNYLFRWQAPARIAKAGFRNISLGVLLGLTDWQPDILNLFKHLKKLEKSFPGVEYSLSFPRLQKVKNSKFSPSSPVTDKTLLKIIACARLLFPRVGINLSTREVPAFRDKIIEFGVTRMSAGSITRVGGYQKNKGEGDKQFETCDRRSVTQIKELLKKKGFDPVFTEWRHI